MATKRRADATEGTEPELTDEQSKALHSITEAHDRIEIALDRDAARKLAPLYEKRRPTLASIKDFWPIAIGHCPEIASLLKDEDADALQYLKDVWVVRDPAEFRAFYIEFHFAENPFFTDTVLKKEFKHIPTPAASSETPDEDGLTPSMIDFDWERDVEPSTIKINWKSNDKNLTKLYPRKALSEIEGNRGGEDDDDDDNLLEGALGSFFNFFESKDDPFDIGHTIADEFFPAAIDYFMDEGDSDWDDEDEGDEEDDDSDAEEIDLEKPKKKKGGKA